MEYLQKTNTTKHIISIPFIYLLIIPFALLDVFVELYHHICFPLYGLPLVKRSKYIIFDRYKLDYIDGMQKTNCTYCAYINGLLKYVTEISAQTEKYWCAIAHANEDGHYPEHHKDFIPYGDKHVYHEKYTKPQNDSDEK